MRTPIRVLAKTVAALAATGILWHAPAAAQMLTVTQFFGTSSGAGQIRRTIIDVIPNEAPRASGHPIRRVTCTVNSEGWTQSHVGWAFRDSCNDQLGEGYIASFDPPGDSCRVKLIRRSGNYSVSDENAVPGITMQVFLPPVPAISTIGLVVLLVGLVVLAWRARRRTRTA